MAQGGLRFARIVVAIVVEENDLAADFGPEPPGRLDFRKQEPPRKKSARLLTEANDGRRHHDVASALAGGLVGPSTAWIIRLNSTQAAHPIKLYQR